MAKQVESKKARGPQVHHFTMLSGERAGLVFSYNAIVMLCDSFECELTEFDKILSALNARNLRTVMLALLEGWRMREKPDREPFTELDAGEAIDSMGGFHNVGKILGQVMAKSDGKRKQVDEAVKKLEAGQESENPTKKPAA